MRHSARHSSAVAALVLVALLVSSTRAEATDVAGTVSANTTWALAGSPYIVTSDVTLAAAATLTIEPGVVVKFDQSMRIAIYGTLMAVGTASQPITFTANQATPTAGYWRALVFTAGAAVSNSRLTHVTVSYGGQNHQWSGYSSVYVSGSSPVFDHLSVLNSATAGIHVLTSDTSPTISNSRIEGSAWTGLQLDSPAAATVSTTEFVNNAGFAIQTAANAQLLDLSGLTFTGNSGGAGNGIAYNGGTITGAETWRAGADWYLLEDLQINAGASLTVNPGVTVKVDQSQRLVTYGTLTAVGTAALPITLASAQSVPTAGYWRSLLFIGSGASNSRLTYVTVSHGGQDHQWSGYAAVYVDGCSPVFDHLTVAHSATAGVHVLGASAALTVAASRIHNSGWSGLQIDSPATATVNTTEFLLNGQYAIKTAANGRLLGLAGLTFSGNASGAGDGIGHYGGTITGAEVWTAGATWYLLEDLQVGTASSTSPSLTVNAGTTVKMDQSRRIVSYGALTATGTVSDPIVFTSAQLTPTAGYWRSLLFVGAGASSGRLSYVTISYGGENHLWSGYAALYLDGSSPTLDHLTIGDSATCGIRAGNSATVAIRDSAFMRNATCGIENYTPSMPLNAKLNFWDSASGPGGQGSGGGQGVSTGVDFEPWLKVLQTQPHALVSATPENRTFNPALGGFNALSFAFSLPGDWAATYRGTSGSVVRSFTGSGQNGSIVWDGRDTGGSLVPIGPYFYDVEGTSPSGAAATARGIAIVDGIQATISGVGLSPPYISPNGDGVQETTTFSGAFNVGVTWQVQVKNAAAAVVRTESGQGSSFSFQWDGRSDGAQMQPDGLYTLEVSASTGTSFASDARSVTLDNTLPGVSITAPTVSQILSNVYAQGATSLTIKGQASDLNFSSWTLEYGAGSAPAAWIALQISVPTPVDGVLAVWPTLDKANGVYSLRLRAADKAGNTQSTTVTPTVGNFKVSQTALEFNPATGQTHGYVSTVPFQLTESIVVKNASGQVVKTVLGPTARSAGTFSDVWNGRNESGSLVADGPYFYVATASTGGSDMTWDLSTEYLANYVELTHNLPIAAFDPFDNSPMVATYNFAGPGRVSFAFSQSPVLYEGNCNAPQFCLRSQEYEESGPHTVTWAGVDATGAFRRDIRGVGIVTDRYQFAKNAVVAYGTKPRVTNVRVAPPVFGPASGTQDVEFDLTTYLNQPVEVTASFLNQSSLSTLRTITVPQQAPGHITVTWDGRADNGILVAPGYYTVTVAVTDSLGNTSRGQILATIQY